MLNSFWGKVGQRSNMAQVEMVNDPSKYFEKLISDSVEVTAINYVSEDYVEMRWKYKEDLLTSTPRPMSLSLPIPPHRHA